MPEPLSTLGLCLVGYTALNVYARGGSAISTEAEHAEKAATELVGSAERSVVLFGEKIDAISQLRAMANECSEPGWDGDAAASMHPDAVYLAEQFVRALPAGIPLPEFAPEPDGSVSKRGIACLRSAWVRASGWRLRGLTELTKGMGWRVSMWAESPPGSLKASRGL
jgi:hypothetical protein